MIISSSLPILLSHLPLHFVTFLGRCLRRKSTNSFGGLTLEFWNRISCWTWLLSAITRSWDDGLSVLAENSCLSITISGSREVIIFFGIVGFPASIFRFITVVRNIWLVISKLLDIFFSLKGPIMASSTWHKKLLAAVERTWQPALYIALTSSESWLSLNFWIFQIAFFTVFSSKFWFIFSTWCNDSTSFY